MFFFKICLTSTIFSTFWDYILAKNNHIFWKYLKNKTNVLCTTAAVSSCLTFRFSADEKKDAHYFWNFKCHRLHRHHFKWPLQSSNIKSKNWKPSAARIIFTRRWNFWLFSILKCYNFFMTILLYKSVVPCNKKLSRNIFTYI